MIRSHRILLFFAGIALLALATAVPVLSAAIGLQTSVTLAASAFIILQAVLSLAGVQRLTPSPFSRFASPLTGEPERTAFA